MLRKTSHFRPPPLTISYLFLEDIGDIHARAESSTLSDQAHSFQLDGAAFDS
jgi:hypothetical protein